jgi:uncharacterized protein (PEP-CTERM system associated)
MKAPENKRHPVALSSACSVAAAMLVLSSYSDAAEWTVVPRLSLRETYSDNLRLGGGVGVGLEGAGLVGGERGDFITQINPGLLVNGLGPRFNVHANYTMNNLIYAQASHLTRIRHQLNARGTAELLEDFFFVDGAAVITQQNVSLFGPQAIDNVNVTGNRADIRRFNVSPYIRHRFKDLAFGELRYGHNIVSSSANSLRNSQGDSFSARLNSGTAFSVLQWGVNYSNNMIRFDSTGRTVELERSIANLRYMVTPQFGLTATGGYERNSFLSIRGNPSSPMWTAGFTWTPSERTNIAANAGQRFFGDTYFADARHRTRLTTWIFNYVEDVTTFNQQALLGGVGIADSLNQLIAAQNPNIDPGTIQQNTDVLLGPEFSGSFFVPTNFVTNRLFLQKRLQASVALNGSRNTLVLRGFNMTRQAYSPESVDADLVGETNAALLNHTQQTGGNATWSYRISELANANLNLGFTRFTYLNTNREDDFKIIRVSLMRRFPQILPNLNGMIEYRHNERDSNQAASYRENAVTAALNMSF